MPPYAIISIKLWVHGNNQVFKIFWNYQFLKKTRFDIVSNQGKFNILYMNATDWVFLQKSLMIYLIENFSGNSIGFCLLYTLICKYSLYEITSKFFNLMYVE